MSTEIELKLEIEPEDLPLLRHDPLLAGTSSHSGHQVTVYYDTADTQLRKHGFTLRVRNANDRFIQTVKATTDHVGLVSREEVEWETNSIEPDLDLLTHHRIHSVLRDREGAGLEAVLCSEVIRTSWNVSRANGRMQIDLDHGTITAGAESVEFAELEFELAEGPPASLIVAARRLADHVPVRLGVLTKAERGFLLADHQLGKVTKSVAVNVNSKMTVAEAFEVIVHACVKHYRLNEPIVLRQSEADALHQCRVAMRRLRSALTIFRPAIEDVEFQHVRQELRWFTGQLGHARNLDVYLERNIDEKRRAKLTRKREKAYGQVADAMNSHSFRRLMVDLVGWVAIGSWRRGKAARRPIGSFANRRLNALWRSIVALGRNVGKMDEVTRHELRIQIKKLRYAIEFLRGLYPDAPSVEKKFARAVEQLQETLGNLNDMATALTLDSAPAEETWLIGSLDERRFLIAAEDALRDLYRIGPFWRGQKRGGPA